MVVEYMVDEEDNFSSSTEICGCWSTVGQIEKASDPKLTSFVLSNFPGWPKMPQV